MYNEKMKLKKAIRDNIFEIIALVSVTILFIVISVQKIFYHIEPTNYDCLLILLITIQINCRNKK